MILDNIYEELRSRLLMQDVVRFYGLEVNRAGFAVCPFHTDNDPSLKVYDDHYHCFGCGAHGDVTDFTARLFELSQYDAAKKLSSDFGLNLIKQESCCHIHQTVNPEIVYRNWLHSAERILNDYLNMLCRWQKQYAPKSPNEPLHPNFVESLTNMDYYNYLYELVRYGDEADKRSLYTTEKKKINELEKRMKQQTVAKPAVKRKAI